MYFVTAPEMFDVIVNTTCSARTSPRLARRWPAARLPRERQHRQPERTAPSMFEPVHGSAPDIASCSVDPTAAIISAAMLCDHRANHREGFRIEQAVADDLVERQGAWAARSTLEIGDDIAERAAKPTGARRATGATGQGHPARW